MEFLYVVGEIQGSGYIYKSFIPCPQPGWLRQRCSSEQMGINIADPPAHQLMLFDKEKHFGVGGGWSFR